MIACKNILKDNIPDDMESAGQTENDVEDGAMTDTEDSSVRNEETAGMQGGESDMTDTGSFNFETRTVRLNSGYEMPVYGIGTYSLTGEHCIRNANGGILRKSKSGIDRTGKIAYY